MSTGEPPLFVLYKGDEVRGVGTAEELAERFDVEPKTIGYWSSPAYRKRYDEAGGGRRMLAVRVDAYE